MRERRRSPLETPAVRHHEALNIPQTKHFFFFVKFMILTKTKKQRKTTVMSIFVEKVSPL